VSLPCHIVEKFCETLPSDPDEELKFKLGKISNDEVNMFKDVISTHPAKMLTQLKTLSNISSDGGMVLGDEDDEE